MTAMFLVLGKLLFVGTLGAAAVRWLTSRRSILAREAGRRIGALVAAWCAWILFICIADNGLDLRLRDLLVLLDFAVVGAMLMWAATRGTWRFGVTGRPSSEESHEHRPLVDAGA
jgi:hypothetical protein